MTKEEAVQFGKVTLKLLEDSKNSSTYQFTQLALDTLEQQPCDDCISRTKAQKKIDEALDKLCKLPTWDGHFDVPTQRVLDIVKEIQLDSLPPVTPTFPEGATNGDMIKAMFPNQTISCAIPITDRNGAKFYRTTINGVTDFTEDWWNEPYKRGNEK